MEEKDMDHRASEPASAVIGHPAVPLLDLQQFCSTEQFRFALHKPFSGGAFSYATDGVIAVRVARREDILEAEQSKYPQTLDGWLVPLESALFEPVLFTVPDDQELETKEECDCCDGRGKEHDCPECNCTCENCNGTGEETIIQKISVTAFGRIFRLKYLRTILQLPCVEVASVGDRLSPLLFRFDGGCGALMPRSSKYPTHIESEPSRDSPIT